MVKHSKEFIEKHKRLVQKREKEALERLELRERKRQESHNRKLEKQRIKYTSIKNNDEKYRLYLEKQKKYREKYKIEREKHRKEEEKIIDERFRDYKKIKLKNFKQSYYIDKFGNLYNSKGVLLSKSKNKDGYIMTNNNLVHRLVWEAFNGEIPEGMEIDHINTIRDDNRLENLRLVTHKENCNNPISVENYKKHNKEMNRDYLKKKKV